MSSEIENFEIESMEIYADFLRVLQHGLEIHTKLVDAAFTVSFSNPDHSREYLCAFRHFVDGVISTVEGLEYYADSQLNL